MNSWFKQKSGNYDLKPYAKMDKNIIKFNDTETEKYKFYQHKSLSSIDNIDTNK